VSNFVVEREFSGFVPSSVSHRCCRHVAKTGDIKDFVITEESGIAKGIRRIVAVTGHEAQDMIRLASELKSRVEQVDTMAGKDKDAALKALSVVSCYLLFLVDCALKNSRNSAKSTFLSSKRQSSKTGSELYAKLSTSRSRREKPRRARR